MEIKSKKKNIKVFLLVTLAGVTISFAICSDCYLSWEGIVGNWKGILLSILYTYILGYGNSYLLGWLDRKSDWLVRPLRKLLINLSALSAFSFFISMIIFYIYAHIFWNAAEWLDIDRLIEISKLPMYISIGFATVFTSADFLKNWKREAVRAEKLEKEKIATQYESLRNQVNPHFLFNSLNVLTALVYENQDTAVKYIRQLADVYRYVLDSQNKDLATLEEEISFLHSFIFLQKMRFDENLIVQMEIEADPARFILPLSLQILMENSIKHNEISSENKLVVEIFEKDGYVVFSNKIVRKRTMEIGTGIGLNNIQSRYNFLSDRPVIIDDTNEYFVVKLPILITSK